MEGGRSSKICRNNSMRASNSGIVIRETNSSSNILIDHNLDAQQTFKRGPDKYVPITSVTRIMRQVLPTDAKIADDVKEIIQKCVSEFIGFITSEANKQCHKEYRKTVTPEDVLSAMGSLGFDNYVETLGFYLNKIRAQDFDRNSMQICQRAKRSSSSLAQIQPPATRPPSPQFSQTLLPPSNYEPSFAAYAIDYTNYVLRSQSRSNLFHIQNQSGDGESSSNNIEEFDPFKLLK